MFIAPEVGSRKDEGERITPMERWCIRVRGIVQGVGFRPFVFDLATRLGLTGSVRNSGGAVVIEAEGDSNALAHLLESLRRQPPALARVEEITWQSAPLLGTTAFVILESEIPRAAVGSILLAADVATCPDCARELFDPQDRRYGYPFLNCTQCGPRLTIITGVPYDRARTTMARFKMCRDCQAEYNNPGNRRFHAQPIACPACGPSLKLMQNDSEQLTDVECLTSFVAAIHGGGIGALKGLGGYHLVCDARRQSTVQLLRQRKQRAAKPFAVMVRDVTEARRYCWINDQEQKILESLQRPIVLLRQRLPREGGELLAEALAPGNPYLGIMLPYTPLHLLLLKQASTMPLVMTSGNRADEPIAYQDKEAFARLRGIADIFLVHDRPIQLRCDDSVTRVVMGKEAPVRRSRGEAPLPLALPLACAVPMLATGGQFKGAFALGRDRQAILSHHLGDLDHWDAYQAFTRDIALYESLFSIQPKVLVHDLHPHYASSNYVRQRAALEGQALIAVQHHHAHLASCLAEHGVNEPAIGVVFDGTGLGTDGTLWGGEFLVGNALQVYRGAHLRPVAMPGGDEASRAPWRMALAHLLDANRATNWQPMGIAPPLSPVLWKTLIQMTLGGINCPRTSSMGRLFDAAAALAGVCPIAEFEGQAAMSWEWLATDLAPLPPYPFGLVTNSVTAPTTVEEPSLSDPTLMFPTTSLVGWQTAPYMPTIIDTRPLIAAVADDVTQKVAIAVIARRFHSTIVEIIVTVCQLLHAETTINLVALSGGVFLNALLLAESQTRLVQAGFRVLTHERVPASDGGLSLGQLAVAAAYWK